MSPRINLSLLLQAPPLQCRVARAQGVTWTGVFNSRRVALGLKVDWAYAPGEVKVLTSSDGANYEEAKCWQSSTRAEVAFEESIRFDESRNVKAVTITMRSPQSWGHFGINSVALVAEPGPFVFVTCGRASSRSAALRSQTARGTHSGTASSDGGQCPVSGH